MRIFKVKATAKWAKKEGISDDQLRLAIAEIENGLFEADLGGHVYKKRVALGGRGKRAGARTIVAYKDGHRAFFMYGFAKGERENIDRQELRAFKRLAQELLGYTDHGMEKAIKAGEIEEISVQRDG